MTLIELRKALIAYQDNHIPHVLSLDSRRYGDGDSVLLMFKKSIRAQLDDTKALFGREGRFGWIRPDLAMPADETQEKNVFIRQAAHCPPTARS